MQTASNSTLRTCTASVTVGLVQPETRVRTVIIWTTRTNESSIGATSVVSQFSTAVHCHVGPFSLEARIGKALRNVGGTRAKLRTGIYGAVVSDSELLTLGIVTITSSLVVVKTEVLLKAGASVVLVRDHADSLVAAVDSDGHALVISKATLSATLPIHCNREQTTLKAVTNNMTLVQCEEGERYAI